MSGLHPVPTFPGMPNEITEYYRASDGMQPRAWEADGVEDLEKTMASVPLHGCILHKMAHMTNAHIST
jgi:hypothetical protein